MDAVNSRLPKLEKRAMSNKGRLTKYIEQLKGDSGDKPAEATATENKPAEATTTESQPASGDNTKRQQNKKGGLARLSHAHLPDSVFTSLDGRRMGFSPSSRCGLLFTFRVKATTKRETARFLSLRRTLQATSLQNRVFMPLGEASNYAACWNQ